MTGLTKVMWLPGWLPGMAAKARAKAKAIADVAERWDERRVATGRYFPGGLPAISTRMAEGIAVAVVALAIKSAPVRTTAELGMILFTISLVVLLLLGLAELRTWWRWRSE